MLILLDLVPKQREYASGPRIIPSEWAEESLWAEVNWEELGSEKAGSTPLVHSWVPEFSKGSPAPPSCIQRRAGVRRRLPPPPTIRWIKIALHRP